MTAYSPLGTPDSADELKRKETPSLLQEPSVQEAAKKLGKEPAQILIRWALQHGTSVIPKATSEAHLKVCFRAGRCGVADGFTRPLTGSPGSFANCWIRSAVTSKALPRVLFHWRCLELIFSVFCNFPLCATPSNTR